ncbi:hypothetical protein TUM20985_03810 [Mycobacterium antarcticum]|uniref:hypothetical protein n=1 Tax=Mycolicibacterium sp. TUM20985 TaxID=3023370 RepID=UPI002573137C|nr:hypothetical protein [Mycolicibacterium sp. TUM20985]BDX29834.1 hypothetical protein TUM20985_03810 [Mycolicibacterium sp. TUM20985]
MSGWAKPWACRAGAAVAIAATLGTLVTIHDADPANADVCVSAGRRVSVSGCANLADVMAPYVPPPDYYAPIPEDYYAPPPPPPPPVSGCIGVNGRRVSVSGCN